MNVPIFNDPVASFSYFSSQIKLGQPEDEDSDSSTTPGGSSDTSKGSKGSNKHKDKSKGKKKKKQRLDDEDEEEMDVESIMCTTCGGGEDEENMLLCDGKGCENAYHLYCLSIPISSIPKGDWFCDECLQAKREEEDKKRRIAAGEKIEEEDDDDWHEEFGFGEGKVFTLESFKKMADNFKRKWFRTDNPDSIAVPQAEEEFWRIVNTCEVLIRTFSGHSLLLARVWANKLRRTTGICPGPLRKRSLYVRAWKRIPRTDGPARTRLRMESPRAGHRQGSPCPNAVLCTCSLGE
jgi:hypothetical protein